MPLLQLSFNLRNQFVPLPVHIILGLEKRTPFQIALGFQSLDLLLSGKLFLQSQCRARRSTDFLDLAIDLFDLSFQPCFQIIGPTIELVCLGRKEAGVSLGDIALDGGSALVKMGL